MNLPSLARRFLPNLSAAAVLGVLNAVYAVSFASLLFCGDLAAFVPAGVGILLFSNAVSSIVLSVTSSVPGLISTFKTNIVVIMSVMAAAIATATRPEQTLPTIVAAMALSSTATGMLLSLLGSLKLGDLLHLIPHPVVGGFLAGTGFLIVKGAVPVILDVPLTIETLPLWWKASRLLLWAPSLLLALCLLAIEKRHEHRLTMPATLLAATGLFYAALLATGTSLAEAKSMGLLLEGSGFRGLFPPIGPSAWRGMDAVALAAQFGSILTIVLVSPLLCLLLISGIEVGTGHEVALERDLKAAGAANVALGLMGGVVSFHTAADTVLGHRLGARSRVVGVLFGLISAACLFLGTGMISFLPRFLMGGVLLYQGLSFLVEWIYRARHRLSRLDHALVVTTLLAVAVLGLAKGILLAVLIAFATSLAVGKPPAFGRRGPGGKPNLEAGSGP